MKIAFVTQPSHPEIEHDDRPLAEALARRGALVLSVAWDDPAFAWSAVDRTLLRSPWDYYLRFDEFMGWLARIEGHTRVINPPAVVRWNADKRYLAQLGARGVHTVPTAFLARNEDALADNHRMARQLGGTWRELAQARRPLYACRPLRASLDAVTCAWRRSSCFLICMT